MHGSVVLRVRQGRFSVTCVFFVPRAAPKHRLVQAPGPGLTVVFLTFLVLAQGGVGFNSSGLKAASGASLVGKAKDVEIVTLGAVELSKSGMRWGSCWSFQNLASCPPPPPPGCGPQPPVK